MNQQAPKKSQTQVRAAVDSVASLKFPESQANFEVQEARGLKSEQSSEFLLKAGILFCFVVVVLKRMLFQNGFLFFRVCLFLLTLCHNHGASPFPMPHLLPHL